MLLSPPPDHLKDLFVSPDRGSAPYIWRKEYDGFLKRNKVISGEFQG